MKLPKIKQCGLLIFCCMIFIMAIASFVFAKPSFEVASQSEPSVSGTTVTPGTQNAGSNVVISTQAVDISGIDYVRAEIKNSSNTTLETIDLYDDGAHNDGVANNDVYAFNWTIPVSFSAGTYKVFIVASDVFGYISNAQQATFNITATCVENWSCGAWSACAGGTQTRTCTDSNNCGTVINKPAVSQACAVPVLTSIVVTPANPTIAVGGTQTFIASPKDQFGNSIATVITWTSSTPAVGTIGAGTGVFTAIAAGTTTITATSGAVSGTSVATVTIGLPVLTSIVVTPVNPNLSVGANINFTATGKDQFNNNIVIPEVLVWSSSDTSKGTIISTTGILTGIAAGTTTITVTNGTISGTTLATVITCAENWFCGLWSTCSGGIQNRTCNDSFHCETEVNKPTVSQSCIIPPPSFDWRNVSGSNWMTPVKNQGGCGSCAAFSVLGSIEARYNIEMNNSNLDVDLSEQDLLSCSSTDNCVTGGNFNNIFSYLRYNIGIVDESCFHYTGTSGLCARCVNWATSLWKINRYDVAMIPGQRDAIKNIIVNVGPVSTAMNMDPPASGGWDSNTLSCTIDSGLNHAVVIAGYDDVGGYWIVRNSWGAGWGTDGGYFKVKYGECGIENLIYSPTGITPP